MSILFFQLPLLPLVLNGDYSKITPSVMAAADGFTYTAFLGLVQSPGDAGCLKLDRASFKTIVVNP